MIDKRFLPALDPQNPQHFSYINAIVSKDHQTQLKRAYAVKHKNHYTRIKSNKTIGINLSMVKM